MKFKKIENPEPIVVNGVEIIPDDSFEIMIDKKVESLKKKFPNAMVVGPKFN